VLFAARSGSPCHGTPTGDQEAPAPSCKDLPPPSHVPRSGKPRTPLLRSIDSSFSAGVPVFSLTAPPAAGPNRSVDSENRGTSSNSVARQTGQRAWRKNGTNRGLRVTGTILCCLGRAVLETRRPFILQRVVGVTGTKLGLGQVPVQACNKLGVPRNDLNFLKCLSSPPEQNCTRGKLVGAVLPGPTRFDALEIRPRCGLRSG
jgi:hypothetical protein